MLNIIKSASLDAKPIILEYTNDVVESIPNVSKEMFPDVCPAATDECAATCSDEFDPDLIAEAQKQADEICSEAKRRAEQILQEAKAESEHLTLQASQDGFQQGVEQGRQEGYEQGYAQGLETGKQEALNRMNAEIEQAAQKAQNMIALAEKDTKETLRQAEHDIVAIIIEAVNKVLAAEVVKDPELILPIVQHALEKVCNQDEIVIRVNPEHYDIVLKTKIELQRLVMSNHQLTFQADPSLAAGDCVIDTKNGVVDARMSTQIEQLTNAIRKLLP